MILVLGSNPSTCKEIDQGFTNYEAIKCIVRCSLKSLIGMISRHRLLPLQSIKWKDTISCRAKIGIGWSIHCLRSLNVGKSGSRYLNETISGNSTVSTAFLWYWAYMRVWLPPWITYLLMFKWYIQCFCETGVLIYRTILNGQVNDDKTEFQNTTLDMNCE